jgi:hypothetical protein
VTKSYVRGVLGLGVMVVHLGALAGAAYGQPPAVPAPQGRGMGMRGMGPGGPMNDLMVWGFIAGRLNVTPDQQQAIRQLLQGSNLPQLQRGVTTARQALAATIISGQDPTAAANQLALAEGQLTTEAAQVAAHAFQTVLTAAQREQARQLWSHRQQAQQQQRQGGAAASAIPRRP